jgi:hypothetical protein
MCLPGRGRVGRAPGLRRTFQALVLCYAEIGVPASTSS